MGAIRKSTDTCASCRKYPLEQAAHAGGQARCDDRETLHDWRDKCVLHMPARDREARRRIVMQLMDAGKTIDAQ